MIPGALYGMWRIALSLLLSAVGVQAQPQTLLDQIQVPPLSEAASCYPGTSGADYAMFLRADQQRIDCDVLGGRTPCLAR